MSNSKKLFWPRLRTALTPEYKCEHVEDNIVKQQNSGIDCPPWPTASLALAFDQVSSTVLVSFLLLWQNNVTRTTYRRRGFFGTSSSREIGVCPHHGVQAGRWWWCAAAERSHPGPQIGSREGTAGMVPFETSKPSWSDTLLPLRLHILILPKPAPHFTFIFFWGP